MSDNKIQVKVSEVLALLDAGKDRKAIAAHYGVSASAVASLFKHPDLKSKKARKPSPFEILPEGDVENVKDTDGGDDINQEAIPGNIQDVVNVEEAEEVVEMEETETIDSNTTTDKWVD